MLLISNKYWRKSEDVSWNTGLNKLEQPECIKMKWLHGTEILKIVIDDRFYGCCFLTKTHCF